MIDEIDKKILTELQMDARTSYAELGRRVGLTTPAVIERIRKLEDAGIVTGYRVEIDPGRPVIFHCRLGARSLLAAQAFRRAGFDAWSMAGGIAQWSEEGRPIEPEGGYVAEH